MPNSIQQSEINRALEEVERPGLEYARFHRYRYHYLVNYLADNLPRERDNVRILDVGPYFQTALFRQFFPEIAVDTLGFDKDGLGRRDHEVHTVIDLNHVDPEGEIPHREAYAFIIYSEVLEHLYTSPGHVLRYLLHYLEPGGLMVLQTPNAVSLPNRIKMLWGVNPFEHIELERQNHFREYTESELKMILRDVGMEIVGCDLRNYFSPETTIVHRAYRRLGRFMPRSLRDGISIIARKPGAA